jgi:plasmid stabilization system protein ParE
VALREHIANNSGQNAALVARLISSRPGRLVGTRELVVPDTSYVIPYRVRLERLELIAVFHGRQKWPAKL